MSEQQDIYEGQFGTFVIEERDRQEVILYRAGLAVAAFSFAAATCAVLVTGSTTSQTVAETVTVCYVVMWLALGLSFQKIHIYLRPLHQTLKIFWAIGGIASLVFALYYSAPLSITAYERPLTILGIGFTFAALTGIFFKEAFCFNRIETKFLVILVPGLLLGHMLGWLSMSTEKSMLVAWALLFVVFAVRKVIQPIPPDIGDKSVFEYLKQQREQAA